MTPDAIVAMGRDLLARVGFTGWSVVLGASPSECRHDTQTIVVSDAHVGNCWWYVKEALLHEMAHIRGAPGAGGAEAHGPDFFRRLSALMGMTADACYVPAPIVAASTVGG